jgi:hypothetical protein
MDEKLSPISSLILDTESLNRPTHSSNLVAAPKPKHGRYTSVAWYVNIRCAVVFEVLLT